MHFSLKYYRHCPLLDKADEIIIKYFEKDAEIINFVKRFKDEQDIVLDITQLPDPVASLDVLKATAAAHRNFSLLCNKQQPYHEFAEANLSFFFIEGASTLDEFRAQCDLGVSDIYVKNELCFSLERIGNILTPRIRVIPNIAQSSSDLYNYKIKKFFIRPEDLELYDDIIDTIEFAGPLITQTTLHRIYFEDGRWLGNLNDLILGLNIDVDSTSIVPHFGQVRLNCGKRCAFKSCHTCDIVLSAAELLKDKGIAITKEKRIYESRVNEEAMSYGTEGTPSDDAGVS